MKHTPVLLNEVVEIFKSINEFTPTEGGGIFVDATIGSAKHAEAILRSSNAKFKSQNAKSNLKLKIVGIDQDYSALELAATNLVEYQDQATLIQGNFRNIKAILKELKIEKVGGIFADLGMSSMQLDDPKRGFSFKHDAPLDMRMENNVLSSKYYVLSEDNKNFYQPHNTKYIIHNTKKFSTGLTAELIIKTWNEAKISDILWQYGEERFARKIARAIKENRKNINSTKDLAEICEKCIPPRFRKYKIHPATRTFQALRIAVNDEIEALKEFLRDAPECLEKGGRLAIISFHSLEDRLVKQNFNLLKTTNYDLITKKPIIPTGEEIAQNPRSRSAKLRAIEKL